MAGTKLSDVIVPKFFDPYVINKSMEKSAFFQSGIISNNSRLNELASQPTVMVNMPYFEDLVGESEQVLESVDLTENKITTKLDIAPIVRRGKMWSATDLAAGIAGSDPMAAIGSLVGDFWSRDIQKELMAILQGVFDSGTMDDNSLDISALVGNASMLSPEAFIDAAQKLGDAQEGLSAIIMHSAVKAYLKKQNLIETQRPSENVEFDTYQSVRVIIDDGCPVSGGVYTSYLFGEGAVAFGNGSPVGFIPSEVDRDRKKGSGVDYLINRRTFILHPRGVKFLGTDVLNEEGPSRSELALGDNWERVYQPKEIRLVQLKYKIA